MKNHHSKNSCVLPLIGLLSVTSLFMSCGRERNPALPRSFVQPLANPEVGGAKPDDLRSRIESGGSSCEALAWLADQSGYEYFSFLSRAELRRTGSGKIAGTGQIELAESPFVQLVLGEKFEVPSRNEFIRAAEQEKAAGRLSGAELFALKQMKRFLPRKFDSVRMKKVSEKLQDKFPGVFGASGNLSGSLAGDLLNRIGAADGDLEEISRWVTTRTPLFVGESWADFADDARQSLSAAIVGIQSESPTERACGLVLLQRGFAQLLKIKGYESPIVSRIKRDEDSSRPRSRTRRLSRGYSRIRTTGVGGAWMSTTRQMNEVLTSEMISDYQPSRGVLTLAEKPEGKKPSSAATDIAGTVAFLEAMTLFYEATSPAAPWFEKNRYPLGDLALSDTAILPADAHVLALGMLGMAFKNLAALGIHKVNATGALLKAGDAATGVMIGSIDSSTGETAVRAEDVARLTRSVAYLGGALKAFSRGGPEGWQAIHPAYSPGFLARLSGRAVFTEAELAGLLSESDRGSILLHTLETLHLPLALLISRVSAGETCVAEGRWNSVTGDFTPLRPCDAAVRAQVESARSALAHVTGSPILIVR